MHDKNQDLAEILRAHDVPAEVVDGWVKPIGHGRPMRAFLVHHNPHESSEVVRLEVQCALEDGRILADSFAGTSDDRDAAYKNAILSFSLSTLHVLLAALYDRPCEDQFIEESWKARRGQWRAFLGNAYLKSMGGSEGEDGGSGPKLPEALVPTIQRVVEEKCPADARLHWVRIFVCQYRGDFTFEANLDSGPWATLEEELPKLPWSPEGEYNSVRLFLLLLPEGDTQGPPPRPVEALVVEKAIHAMVEEVHANPEVSDDELATSLAAKGLDTGTVDQLITFAPMGFSSLLLAQATLPTTFETLDDQGRIAGEYSLFGEPAFCVASCLASILAADPSQKEKVLAFASRCSMLNVANKMLYEGSKIEDLKFTPFLVLRARPSSLPLPRPAPAAAHVEAAASKLDPSPSPANRPWWKFWKRR